MKTAIFDKYTPELDTLTGPCGVQLGQLTYSDTFFAALLVVPPPNWSVAPLFSRTLLVSSISDDDASSLCETGYLYADNSETFLAILHNKRSQVVAYASVRLRKLKAIWHQVSPFLVGHRPHTPGASFDCVVPIDLFCGTETFWEITGVRVVKPAFDIPPSCRTPVGRAHPTPIALTHQRKVVPKQSADSKCAWDLLGMSHGGVEQCMYCLRKTADYDVDSDTLEPAAARSLELCKSCGTSYAEAVVAHTQCSTRKTADGGTANVAAPWPGDYHSQNAVPLSGIKVEDYIFPYLHVCLGVWALLWGVFIAIIREDLDKNDPQRCEMIATREQVAVDLDALDKTIQYCTDEKKECDKDAAEVKTKLRTEFKLTAKQGFSLKGMRTKVATHWYDDRRGELTVLIDELEGIQRELLVLAEEKKKSERAKTVGTQALDEIDGYLKGSRGRHEEVVMVKLEKGKGEGGCAKTIRAYFGGAFVGGDIMDLCSLYCGVYLFMRLFDALFTVTAFAAMDITIQIKLIQILALMIQWAKLLHVIRKSGTLSEEDLVFLERECPKMARAIRAAYGIGGSLKLHLLECHLAEHSRRTKCGYMLSEEAGEAAHAELNGIKRKLCRMRDRRAQFKLAFELKSTKNSEAVQRVLAVVESLKVKRGPYKKARTA